MGIARRWLVLGAAAIVAGGLLVGRALGGTEGWGVVVPGGSGGGFGISLPATEAGRPYTFGAIVLCLAGVDGAVVDSVTMESGDGLTVTGFALRPLSREGFGAEQVALTDTGFGADRAVRGQCSAGTGSEMAVEFTKRTAGPARADGLLVHWHGGGRSGTTPVPMQVVLCPGPVEAVSECEAVR